VQKESTDPNAGLVGSLDSHDSLSGGGHEIPGSKEVDECRTPVSDAGSSRQPVSPIQLENDYCLVSLSDGVEDFALN
jgi:hypothetical protein